VVGRYWKTGLGEMVRSCSKSAFTRALQRLMPDIRIEDLEAGGAGVRARRATGTAGCWTISASASSPARSTC
jgi:L-2-hydroxyglutarate oxidase